MMLSYILVLVASYLSLAFSIELTFELPDNSEQCFYEEIKNGTECVIEFQVVTGGQYDVDMHLKSPNGKTLYKDIKKQYDSYSWKADVTGSYEVCFSNEFSTFSHKVVYMDWQIGEESRLPGLEHIAAMTAMETSCETIHEKLKVVDDYQTHNRLREATGRKRGEDLHDRVMWWSVGETIVILFVGIGQVLIMRSFFTEKRTISFT